MNFALRALLAALTCLSLATNVYASPPAEPGLGVRPATEDPAGPRVIVKFKTHSNILQLRSSSLSPRSLPQQATSLTRRLGLTLRDGHAIDEHSQVVHGERGMSSAELATRLAADPSVEYAVPDLRRRALAIPDDSLYAANNRASPAVRVGQWYLRAADTTAVSAINAEGAWDISIGISSTRVAVLDTGVLFNHPDLLNKLLPGRNFVSSSDAMGNGWSADASDPGDFTAKDQCNPGEPASHSSWHGTQTASLIGAQSNNALGMASVGREVMVLPIRVLGPCGGFDSDIIAAMLWAAGLSQNPVANPTPAKILNLSLGGTNTCSAAYADVFSRLSAADVVTVVAAGNDEGLPVGSPANCPGAIAVAGVRHVGTKVGFSNIGPEIALAAPGGNCVNLTGSCLYPIITASNSGAAEPNTAPSGYIFTDSIKRAVGTSFAAPLVAGTAALMLSVNPSLKPAQIKNLLQLHARPFPARPVDAIEPACVAPSAEPQDECYCTTTTCGAGLLDAQAAVAAAAASVPPVVTINASATSVPLGTSVELSNNATLGQGKTITSYNWSMGSGANLASFSGGTNGATAKLDTVGKGQVTINLTVTDSAGLFTTASLLLTVGAAAVQISIVPSATQVTVGESITLTGIATTINGRTVADYHWSILSGGGLGAFSGEVTGPTAELSTLGAGSITLQLTATDNLGVAVSQTQTISVVTKVVPAVTASSSSGKQGGSVGWGWLLLLGMGCFRRRQRAG